MTDKDLGAAAGDIFAKAFTLGYEAGRTYDPGALFPATEPAEDVVTVTDGDVAAAWEDGFTAGCGHTSVDCQAPSTTFAAEEETKEEGLSNVELSCLKLICDLCKKSYKGTVWLPINDMVQGFVDRHYLTRGENDSCKPTINAEKALASSPVVPAPTETEWATVVEIPVGAAFRPAGYTGPSYIIKTALGYRITPNGDHRLWNGAPVGTLAPFVAAGEGRA